MKQALFLLGVLMMSFFPARQAGAQAHSYLIPGDLIVQMEPGTAPEVLIPGCREFLDLPTGLEIARLLSRPLDIWLLRFDPSFPEREAFLEHIRRQPGVLLAQFNHYIHLRDVLPDDPELPAQWQWLNTGDDGGVPDADVDAEEAWEITTGGYAATGEEIVICVVEPFGMNIYHPDLEENMWKNLEEIPYNGQDDDGNGYVDDYRGWNTGVGNDIIENGSHGTKVSGMAGAKGDNGQGVTGINWDVRIMPVDMLPMASEANVVEAYTYPYVMRKRFNETGGAQGAFVVAINSSWGIDGGQPADAPVWCAFYDSLGAQGILSVAATCNNTVNVDAVGDLPTACPSEYLITVTATDRSDTGHYGYGLSSIDVGAPGVEVKTTAGAGSYSVASGTSVAAPVVTGLIGLMYSVPCLDLAQQALLHPAETALYVRNALFAGVDGNDDLTVKVKTGGRVNAFNSVSHLSENCGPCPPAFGMKTTAAAADTVVLSWYGAPGAEDFHLRYRQAGAVEWDTLSSVQSPLVLSGLETCQTYEYQVFTDCGTASSGYQESAFFNTYCYCPSPANLDTLFVAQTQVYLAWDEAENAQTYLVGSKPLTATEWTFTQAVGPEWVADSLEACKHYQFQVKTICPVNESEFHPELLVKTDCGPSSVEEPAALEPGMFIFPNPFRDQARIRVVLEEASALVLEIMDPLGRVVYSRDMGLRPKGSHFLELPSGDLATGVYWVRILTETGRMQEKVIRQ